MREIQRKVRSADDWVTGGACVGIPDLRFPQINSKILRSSSITRVTSVVIALTLASPFNQIAVAYELSSIPILWYGRLVTMNFKGVSDACVPSRRVRRQRRGGRASS